MQQLTDLIIVATKNPAENPAENPAKVLAGNITYQRDGFLPFSSLNARIEHLQYTGTFFTFAQIKKHRHAKNIILLLPHICFHSL